MCRCKWRGNGEEGMGRGMWKRDRTEEASNQYIVFNSS